MQELYDPDVRDPTQVSPQGRGSQDKQSGLDWRKRPAANLQLEASRDLERQIIRKGAHYMHTYL